ncbi:MAG: hypothetical protein RLZZ08_1690 [Pseudomonadota bacterium]|jgi:hypothetical protein
MTDASGAQPHIDRLTIVGLGLLLMPLMTMAHEIGGHAAACIATGGAIRNLGAFYVDCAAPGDGARRIVALAGMGMDAALGLLAYAMWRRVRGDLARLVCWYLWLCLSFSAAGYFLFSGVAGIGDLAPAGNDGIGPLPQARLWRLAFTAIGGMSYFLLVRAGMAALATMIGQGLATRRARRCIAHLFYAVVCMAAIAASIPNPVGLFITLASAGAASLGGKAGLISIGYATREQGTPRAFVISRNVPLLVLGIAASLAFAAVLGPTMVLR